ncbi:mycofactocin precursor MftA [Rubrobacter xylanophilus]
MREDDRPEEPSRTGGGESGAVEEEILIEEVSIDGMCGVY